MSFSGEARGTLFRTFEYNQKRMPTTLWRVQIVQAECKKFMLFITKLITLTYSAWVS